MYVQCSGNRSLAHVLSIQQIAFERTVYLEVKRSAEEETVCCSNTGLYREVKCDAIRKPNGGTLKNLDPSNR